MARKKAISAPSPADDNNGNPLRKFSDKVIAALNRIEARFGRTSTQYQSAIFAWMIEESGHTTVNAVAGSGKTTTLMDSVVALTYGTYRPSILMLAFGHDIAKELNFRIKQYSFSNVTAKTLNGLGFGALLRHINGAFTPILDRNKTEIVAKRMFKYDKLEKKDRDDFDAIMPSVKRLVDLFKGFGYGAIRDFPTVDDVTELCERYEIEIPEDVDVNRFYNCLFKTYEKGFKDLTLIDFNDQLILAIHLNLPLPTSYKFVFIDESQDLNPIQIEMVKRICARGARAVFVGDRNQAIYGFRGADPEAMDTVVRDFKASAFPLSISWRCSKAVVRRAQRIVPYIEAAPNAIEGIEETINEDKFIDMVESGDFVLCRTCAPLTEYCMQLIRSGIKATIKGSDIGEGLISLLRKVGRAKLDGPIWDQIDTFASKQISAINKPGQETKAEKLKDRFDTLKVLAEECETASEVESKIRQIFSDNIRGVMLSTIHKSKGLEAKRVFVIHPELLPHPMAKKEWARNQESNLEYVAITRALSDLYWVTPKKAIRFGPRTEAA